ncbi:phosphodiester glycosidase family protein [Actinomyces ruminis]|uniref:phosphodiester glycosidase family protein n=1 Tax=Actinomyces ruminis TaxID=1937003 RepID=UPI0030B832DA
MEHAQCFDPWIRRRRRGPSGRPPRCGAVGPAVRVPNSAARHASRLQARSAAPSLPAARPAGRRRPARCRPGRHRRLGAEPVRHRPRGGRRRGRLRGHELLGLRHGRGSRRNRHGQQLHVLADLHQGRAGLHRLRERHHHLLRRRHPGVRRHRRAQRLREQRLRHQHHRPTLNDGYRERRRPSRQRRLLRLPHRRHPHPQRRHLSGRRRARRHRLLHRRPRRGLRRNQHRRQALLDDGVWNTLSFGPALVRGGSVLDGIDSVEVDTNFGNHSIQGTQPRTALGAIADGHYVFVVVDGRDKGYSRGVTMTELAQIMADLGCESAYNLDGGGSSTLWFNGSVVNQPSNGGERETSDILYIAQGA